MVFRYQRTVDRALKDLGMEQRAIASLLRAPDAVTRNYMAIVLFNLGNSTAPSSSANRLQKGITAENLFYQYIGKQVDMPDSLAVLDSIAALVRLGHARITNADSNAVAEGSKAPEYAITESGRVCIGSIRWVGIELNGQRRSVQESKVL